MKLTKGLTWPFLLLALAATFVYLAGIAALQYSCWNSGGFSDLAGNSSPTGVFGMSSGTPNCHRVLRWYWFTFAFVFVTLVGILITAATTWGLHHSRPYWTAMVAISTVLMMIASEATLAFTDLYEGGAGTSASSSWISRWRTAAAGAIIDVAALVFLLMALGTDWEKRTGRGAGYHEGGDKPVSAIGTTASPAAVAVPVQNVRPVEAV